MRKPRLMNQIPYLDRAVRAVAAIQSTTLVATTIGLGVAWAMDRLPSNADSLLPFALTALGCAALFAFIIALPVISALSLPPRGRLLVGAVAASALGWACFDSLMRGDGIRGLEWYWVIRIGGGLTVGVGFSLSAILVLWPSARWGPVWPWLALSMTASLALMGLWVGGAYPLFQGYSLLILTLSVSAALHRLTHGTRWLERGLLIGAVFLIGIASFVKNGEEEPRRVQRYTVVPGALFQLPGFELLAHPPRGVLNESPVYSRAEVMGFEKSLAEAQQSQGKKRGKNVLFLVLESTRADVWSSPSSAPRFHQYRKHGTYFETAIAQYPATPLAYGAMFAAQSPAVLVRTSSWAKSQILAPLIESFDTVLMTRPKNQWFDRSSITGFVAEPGQKLHVHQGSPQALDYLRQELQSAGKGSFFAWAHLYEPHQPWNLRPAFLPPEERGKAKKGTPAAYRSEVRRLDSILGDFMSWFYDQPFAEETLVIIISDHGEGLGERIDGVQFFGHHVHVRNMVTHIPAYFSGPGVDRNRVVRGARLQQLDIVPTLFDYVGEKIPRHSYAQGRSLYSILKSDEERDLVSLAFSIRGRRFFAHIDAVRAGHRATENHFQRLIAAGSYPPKVALQYGQWKVIQDLTTGELTLYNHDEDPKEQRDLSRQRPETLEMMRRRLESWGRKQSWIAARLEETQSPSPN